MKIPLDYDCPELHQVDTTPSAQFEVDLAYVEHTPKPLSLLAIHAICVLVRPVEFGRN